MPTIALWHKLTSEYSGSRPPVEPEMPLRSLKIAHTEANLTAVQAVGKNGQRMQNAPVFIPANNIIPEL